MIIKEFTWQLGYTQDPDIAPEEYVAAQVPG